MILLGSSHENYLQYENSRISLYYTHVYLPITCIFWIFFFFLICLFSFGFFSPSLPLIVVSLGDLRYSGHSSFFMSSGSNLRLAMTITLHLHRAKIHFYLHCHSVTKRTKTEQAKDLPPISHILLSLLHYLGVVPLTSPWRHVQVSRAEGPQLEELLIFSGSVGFSPDILKSSMTSYFW